MGGGAMAELPDDFDMKNERRLFLIQKMVDKGLDKEEKNKLELLQEWAGGVLAKAFPYDWNYLADGIEKVASLLPWWKFLSKRKLLKSAADCRRLAIKYPMHKMGEEEVQ